MLSKTYKMRRTFILSRRVYAKTSWKIILYLAVIVLVIKVVRDITEISVTSWSQEKLNFKHRKSQIQIGDISFVAGKFLESVHPSTNISYCMERWTILNNINNASGSPELGFNGPYRVIYDVIRGNNIVENGPKAGKKSGVGCVSHAGVTYVTHATPEYLYLIAELLGRWEGPISVAVYAPGTDAEIARYVLTRLCRCLQPQQARRLSVQFVFHVNHPPDLSKQVFSEINVKEGGKCGPPSVLLNPTYRTKMGLAYPVNVGRNVARAAARTPHIFVSDVELLPSKGLATQFCSMLGRANRRQGLVEVSKNWISDVRIPIEIPLPQPAASGNGGVRRLAFVVPVFEVELGENVPETKEQLLGLLAADRAFYFHRWQCVHCQKFPGIHLWMEEKKGVPGNLQPLVMVRREFPYHRWEPIYIGTNREPLYSEVLTWEGQQDKMTQMHQMCLLGYHFVILDRAFLVHTPGVKRPQPAPQSLRGTPIKMELDPAAQEQKEWLKKHEKRNTHFYEMIVESMNLAHPRNPKCKTH